MWVGATLKKEEIAYWEPKMRGNDIIRIFPSSDKIPAAANDTRYAYCKRVGAIPFISGKCDGDTAKLGSASDARSKRTYRNVIMDLIDAGFPIVYATDHHEPEGDAKADGSYSASVFKTHFSKFWAMIQGLPAAYRAKVKAGPCMTKQWTENGSGRTYDQWDPGYGDFYALDCYLNTWNGSQSDKPFTAFPNAATWLSRIKAYRFNSSDTRPRIFAELGAVGIPWDTNGAARAAFYQALHTELKTWGPTNTAWQGQFLGYILWNTKGTGGSHIDGVGQQRWFQFDRRHNGKPYKYTVTKSDGTTEEVTDPEGNYDTVSSSQVTAKYNVLWQAEHGGTTPVDPPPTGGAQTVVPSGVLSLARVGTPAITLGTRPPVDPGDPQPPIVVTDPVDVVDQPAALAGSAFFTMLVTSGDDLRALAPPIVWRNIDVTLKRNAVGSGVLTMSPTAALVDALNAPNSRITVYRNPAPALGLPGVILASGPIEKPGGYRWSIADSPAGELKVGFATNEVYLAERLTWPSPLAAITAQAAAYVINNVVAETAMRQLVNENIGPGASTARRHPLLVLGAATGVGSPVTISTRFESLTDVLRTIALAGGDLTFRVRDTGTQLVFEVYAGRVRNGAVFSRQRGNLRSLESDPTNPTATVAIVGGSGEGSSRALFEHGPDTTWRRMETFVNQSTSATATELEQIARAALLEKGEKVGLSAGAVDPYGGGYGTKYHLGDMVPVEVAGGQIRLDVVSAVRIVADAGGPVTFTPTIGADADITAPAHVRLVKELLRRLARTERR